MENYRDDSCYVLTNWTVSEAQIRSLLTFHSMTIAQIQFKYNIIHTLEHLMMFLPPVVRVDAVIIYKISCFLKKSFFHFCHFALYIFSTYWNHSAIKMFSTSSICLLAFFLYLCNLYILKYSDFYFILLFCSDFICCYDTGISLKMGCHLCNMKDSKDIFNDGYHLLAS